MTNQIANIGILVKDFSKVPEINSVLLKNFELGE